MVRLKRGAVVELRSGGPEMTIEKIETHYGSPELYARCQWFDKMRLRQGTFAVHALEVRDGKAGAGAGHAGDAPDMAPAADAPIAGGDGRLGGLGRCGLSVTAR